MGNAPGYQFCALNANYQQPVLEVIQKQRSPLSKGQHAEDLMQRLFRLQDLKGDNLLEEQELIELNEKIAILHYGSDIDTQALSRKYQCLFREKLSVDGTPVGYNVFRTYMFGVLDELDPDVDAQEMILEQFVVEAQHAHDCFSESGYGSEPLFAVVA
mmetsp:Transcript_52127/g.96499  ORF Transcript_52127/g.96499 Transcript_52127/m.96499 type:complete len:158 (-) Transcript_52127:42-515(-)